MARWRIDYIGRDKHLGTVDAPDERSLMAEAAKELHITSARRFKPDK